MRVRLDRYESANRSMTNRTMILFVLGGIGAVVAAFGLFFGFAMIVMPDKESGDGLWARRAGIFLSVFFGLLPAAVSSLLIGYGARQRTRYRQLGELAAVARQSGGMLTTPDVARGLGTTPQLAERLIVDAAKLGLIEHGAPLDERAQRSSHGPPPNAPTPPPSPPAFGYLPPSASLGPTIAAPPAARVSVPDEAVIVAPGSILGATYRIEEPLGRGGMGEVFAARHLRTGRRYAVKTILPGPRADEAAFRRFEREATAASALGHPGIVQVHDFNATSSGTFYLVMDLLEGETLEQRLEKGPLAWPDAQRIALELCSALGTAHEHGLIHRDIKPSNVFLASTKGAPERCVLVDFGLVKPLEESGSLLTAAGAVVGTPVYMSPEQARGEVLDVRSDLYSLAAVLFEAITGAPPFLDRTLAAVYARLLGEPAPLASRVAKHRVPDAVDEVLARALAKDRSQRYPSARALGEAIAVIGDDHPATERMANR
jgi:hypothetical protein